MLDKCTEARIATSTIDIMDHRSSSESPANRLSDEALKAPAKTNQFDEHPVHSITASILNTHDRVEDVFRGMQQGKAKVSTAQSLSKPRGTRQMGMGY